MRVNLLFKLLIPISVILLIFAIFFVFLVYNFLIHNVAGESFGLIVQFFRTIALANIAAFVLFLITLVLVIRFTILNPLREMKKGTLAYKKENFDYRVENIKNDELGDLAKEFNNMAASLKEVEKLREAHIKAEALSESLQKAKDLGKLKDSFITMASHQLRTPLSAIQWSLELDMEKVDKPCKAILSEVYNSTEQLIAIVNDLLAISEFGFILKREDVKPDNIEALVHESISKFKEKANKKNIRIHFGKPARPLKVFMSFTAMVKVVDNLIDNAITYTKEGGEIAIDIFERGQFAQFSISDNGIGIPQNEQQQIFEQFFRASNSIEQKTVGTGLGLFIVKLVIEGHRGRVWFTSKLGKGTTFYFTLPLVR